MSTPTADADADGETDQESTLITEWQSFQCNDLLVDSTVYYSISYGSIFWRLYSRRFDREGFGHRQVSSLSGPYQKSSAGSQLTVHPEQQIL